MLSHRVAYGGLFYMLSMILIVLVQPSFMFTPRGDIKPFGVGHDGKTIISFGTANAVCAIFSFYVFAVIDVIFV